MNIECPKCEKEIDVTDHLPPTASDANEYECECGCVMEIGWYAEAEIRKIIKD